jgi:adenylosuccinate lyase
MLTVYADQISEHQRDLTNSASQRFLPEMVVALVSSVRRMIRIMSRLVVDQKNMEANFAVTAGMIAAEPAYILLAAAGHPDAHEAVRRITLEAQQSGVPFQELLFAQEDLQDYLNEFTPEQRELLHDPRRYTGIAATRTEQICAEWEKLLTE